MFETRARLQTLVSELQAAAPPAGDPPLLTSGADAQLTGDSKPGPSVTLEAIKDKMLGAVLGDMMSALAVDDVAQRRAKLREIEAAHGEGCDGRANWLPVKRLTSTVSCVYLVESRHHVKAASAYR